MVTQDLSFSAKIRKRQPETTKASRHMISVPKKIGKIIQKYQDSLPKKRWRKSVKVEVRIWFYTRHTSVFSSKEMGVYVLPIKKEARKELRVGDGDEVYVNLVLM